MFSGCKFSKIKWLITLHDAAFLHILICATGFFFSAAITAKHGLQTRTFAAKHNEQCSHFNGFTLEIPFLIKSPLLGLSCNVCTARNFMFGYSVSSCCDRTSRTIMALPEMPVRLKLLYFCVVSSALLPSEKQILILVSSWCKRQLEEKFLVIQIGFIYWPCKNTTSIRQAPNQWDQ